MEREVSAHLIIFADSLNPSEELIKKGKSPLQEVFRSLQPNYKISRKIYGGSVGKHTSVIQPDFDCVIFLNNRKPPFKKLLNKFKNILENKAEHLSIDPGSIRYTDISISFQFRNGAEVDLLPAMRFFMNPFKQWKVVRRMIRRDLDNIRKYECSLVEIQVDFLKKQDSFTHQLIRLTKYWFKSLTLKNYIYGGSAIMEMICVAVRLEQLDQPSMLSAFKRVLLKIQHFDTLKIVFMRTTLQREGAWRLVSEEELRRTDYVPKWILQRPSFIIEPSNPMHDLATNLTGPVRKQLKQCARDLLQRLAILESPTDTRLKQISTGGRTITKIYFNLLFQPFPMNICGEYQETENIILAAKVLYHFSLQYNSILPRKIERRRVSRANLEKISRIVKVLENNLMVTLRNLAIPGPDAFFEGLSNISSVREVKNPVKRLLSRNFQGVWHSTIKAEHNQADLTIYMPYKSNDLTYAVQVSVFWN